MALPGEGGAVDKIEVQRPMLDGLTPHLDHAALADLAGEAGEEFLPRTVLFVAVVGEAEFLDRVSAWVA